jgi:hypothetical protein
MTKFLKGDKVVLVEEFPDGPGWISETMDEYLENGTVLEVVEEEDVNGWIQAVVKKDQRPYYYPKEALRRVSYSKRKHAELIHAWADGASIQLQCRDGRWEDLDFPSWDCDGTYRLKPQKQKPVVFYIDANYLNCLKDKITTTVTKTVHDTIKVEFDSETQKLISVEKLV